MIWRDHVFNFGPKLATRVTKICHHRSRFWEPKLKTWSRQIVFYVKYPEPMKILGKFKILENFENFGNSCWIEYENKASLSYVQNFRFLSIMLHAWVSTTISNKNIIKQLLTVVKGLATHFLVTGFSATSDLDSLSNWSRGLTLSNWSRGPTSSSTISDSQRLDHLLFCNFANLPVNAVS